MMRISKLPETSVQPVGRRNSFGKIGANLGSIRRANFDNAGQCLFLNDRNLRGLAGWDCQGLQANFLPRSQSLRHC